MRFIIFSLSEVLKFLFSKIQLHKIACINFCKKNSQLFQGGSDVGLCSIVLMYNSYSSAS